MLGAGRSPTAVVPLAGAVPNVGPTSWRVAETATGRMSSYREYGMDDGNLPGAALATVGACAWVTHLARGPAVGGASLSSRHPPPDGSITVVPGGRRRPALAGNRSGACVRDHNRDHRPPHCPRRIRQKQKPQVTASES